MFYLLFDMRNKKWIIIIISILLFLGFTLGGAQYAINNKLNDLLQHKLPEQLGNGYRIDYKNCHFSILNNKLSLNDLRFTKAGRKKYEWTFTASDVDFKGFRAVSFLLGKGFGLDKLVIEKPALNLMHVQKSDSTHTNSTKSSQKIPDVKISIGAIISKNGTFNFDPDGPEEFSCLFTFTLNEIDFKGKLKNIEKLWDNSEVNLQKCHYQFSDSTYFVNVDEVDLPKAGSEISIDNLRFQSNLSKQAFPKKFGWRKSRFDISTPHIQIARPKNFDDSLLVISKIKVDSLNFELHKDSRYPWPDRVTELPQEGIKNISMAIDVDSVLCSNSHFTFISVFEDGAPSRLDFSDITASLSGFQNIDTTKAAFTFNTNASFMKTTNVETEIKYMYGKNDPFECSAIMGKTKLGFMSNFLQSAAGIRIEDGSVEKLELHMNGNKYGEQGYVDFYYNDLDIKAVNKETGEKKWLLNVAADLASGVLFWKKNPDNKNFRRGEFQKSRTVYKGFPSQWIEGLFAGILDSVSKIDPVKFQQKK